MCYVSLNHTAGVVVRLEIVCPKPHLNEAKTISQRYEPERKI